MHKNKKLTILIIAIIILAIAGAGYYFAFYRSTPQTSAGKSRNTVNYSGPTTEEKQAGNEQKAIDAQRNSSTAKPTTANLVITNTSQSDTVVRVRALVSNIVESSGTCTTKLQMGNTVATKVTQAFPDASTTQCGAIDFDKASVPAGTWNITVNYTSPSSTGSATTSMVVQ